MTESTEQSTEHATEQPAEHPRELVSRREFARRKGWVISSVVEACQAGKISVWVNCPACGSTCNSRAAACTCGQAIAGVVDSSKGKIDPAHAELELARARHPEKAHVTQRWQEQRGGDEQLPLEPAPTPSVEPTTGSYAAAKASSEHFKALSAEFEFRRKVGEFVPAESSRRAAFQAARWLRDYLNNLSSQLAPQLAAERQPEVCKQMLDDALRRACDEFSRSTGSESGALGAAE